MFDRALASVNGHTEGTKIVFFRDLQNYLQILYNMLASTSDFNVATTDDYARLFDQYEKVEQQFQRKNLENLTALLHQVKKLESSIKPLFNNSFKIAKERYEIAREIAEKNPVIKVVAEKIERAKTEELRYPLTVSAAIEIREKNKKNNPDNLLSPRTSNDINEITHTYGQYSELKDLKITADSFMQSLQMANIHINHSDAMLNKNQLKLISNTGTHNEKKAAHQILKLLSSRDFKIPRKLDKKIKSLEKAILQYELALMKKDNPIHNFNDESGLPARTLLDGLKLNVTQMEEMQIAILQKVMNKAFLNKAANEDVKPTIDNLIQKRNDHLTRLLDHALIKINKIIHFMEKATPRSSHSNTFSGFVHRTSSIFTGFFHSPSSKVRSLNQNDSLNSIERTHSLSSNEKSISPKLPAQHFLSPDNIITGHNERQSIAEEKTSPDEQVKDENTLNRPSLRR